jgi:hypothetical protein
MFLTAVPKLQWYFRYFQQVTAGARHREEWSQWMREAQRRWGWAEFVVIPGHPLVSWAQFVVMTLAILW